MDVWRYIGKYGDCYALLLIETGIGWIEEKPEPPYLLSGFDREVLYHKMASVMLYNTKDEVPVDWAQYTKSVRLAHLLSLEIHDCREEWITDAQLEELARDIEKIAKSH